MSEFKESKGGTAKRCVNLSNLGEKCGGTFLCGCARGLMCQRHEDTIGNKLKIGVGNCVPYIDLPKN